MEVSDLKKIDPFRIYDTYLSVKEAKDMGIIPKEFYNVINDRCECGSEFMIKSNLKYIRCCDPGCPFKIANAMAEMFTRFGVKGIKVGTCKKIVEWANRNNYFKIPAHTEILNLRHGTPEGDSLSYYLGVKYFDLIEGLRIIRHTSMSFAEMVSKLAIPNFDNKSISVLSKINNSRQLLELLNQDCGKGLIEYLVNMGVKSPEIIYSLIINIETINECEKNLDVPLRNSGVFQLNIAISGALSVDGRKISRDAFTMLCNKLGSVDGVQVLSITVGKAFQSADYFIIDNMSSSKTCQAALSRQSFSDSKIIFTADEFIQMLVKEG